MMLYSRSIALLASSLLLHRHPPPKLDFVHRLLVSSLYIDPSLQRNNCHYIQTPAFLPPRASSVSRLLSISSLRSDPTSRAALGLPVSLSASSLS